MHIHDGRETTCRREKYALMESHHLDNAAAKQRASRYHNIRSSLRKRKKKTSLNLSISTEVLSCHRITLLKSFIIRDSIKIWIQHNIGLMQKYPPIF